jgi:hypothetical protein
VRIWAPRQKKLLQQTEDNFPYQIQDGVLVEKNLWIGTMEGLIWIDLDNISSEIPEPRFISGPCKQVQLSPCGNFIAALEYKTRIVLIRVDTGEFIIQIDAFNCKGPFHLSPQFILAGQKKSWHSLTDMTSNEIAESPEPLG